MHFSLMLLPVGVLGGLACSYIGACHLRGDTLRRILGALLLTVLRYLLVVVL